ncbi:G-X-X-X-Q-X-W domain-containing protein [Pholiota conissans]|uniref:G-X-X-X-Q-X-W domain-containing protein n=1 Tax=Pholiota conissans TaxID=109636 RepID=A0A9P6CR67_9AGAR|nr:G-X-X-X-Q-X-W domain-containing protein [Pholiota conissans]
MWPTRLTPFLLLSLSLVATPALAQDTVNHFIYNECPTPINLFIGGNLETNIPVGGMYSKVTSIYEGYWYTDANGGRYTGVGTTRAAFWNPSIYALIKDAGQINTGMQLGPVHRPNPDGTCAPVICNDATCNTTFIGYPPHLPVGPTAPAPFHYCDMGANTSFSIIFCPDGTFPPNTGVEIQPLKDAVKCLDVRGANFANGTPVQIYDCNGTGAQKWFFVRGSTKVRLANTNFCLDAGSTPANGVGLKIWQCYDNLPAQQWNFTADNRIALENQGLCADLTDGVTTNGEQMQAWQCTYLNNNQVWNVYLF